MTTKIQLNSTKLPQKLADKLNSLHEISIHNAEVEQELNDLRNLRKKAKNLVDEILIMHGDYYSEMVEEMNRPNVFFQKMPESFQDMWKNMQKVPDFCDNIIDNI